MPTHHLPNAAKSLAVVQVAGMRSLFAGCWQVQTTPHLDQTNVLAMSPKGCLERHVAKCSGMGSER